MMTGPSPSPATQPDASPSPLGGGANNGRVRGSRTRALGSIVSGVCLVAYPGIAYFALRHLSPRAAAALMLLVLAPAIAPRLRSFDRGALRSIAALPLLSVALLVASAALNSSGLVMLVPVVLNLGFLLLFGNTLRGTTPMIERFARLTDSDLTPAEQRWCRLWTWIWVVFFGGNIAIAGSLAAAGAIGWWTTYTGLISYVIMGLLFGVEYPIRKYRFGRLRSHFLDQQLERSFRAFRARRD